MGNGKRKKRTQELDGDDELYEIEAFIDDIREIPGKPGPKRLKILVKWKGYPLNRDIEESWKPIDELMQEVPDHFSLWARSKGYAWPFLMSVEELATYDLSSYQATEYICPSDTEVDSLFGADEDYALNEKATNPDKTGETNVSSSCSSTDDDSLFDEERQEKEGDVHLAWPSKKPKAQKPHTISTQAVQYTGPPIEIVRQDTDQFFLKFHFGDRLRVEEHVLTKATDSLPVQKVVHEQTYQLAVTKLVCSRGQTSYKLPLERSKVRAYYIRELQEISVKKEFEELGCFDGIIPGKIKARMELTISPVAMSASASVSGCHPLSFMLQPDEIELVEENGNVGCGFIPQSFLLKWLGNLDFPAIQVRIISPTHGWAKGMLILKPGISRIQLPPSMIKVGPSKSPSTRELSVFVGIRAYFPSASSRMMGRFLNPNLPNPPKSSEKDLKRLRKDDQLWNVLLGNGVTYQKLCAYADESRTWARRNHCMCVGVVDPTGKLPPGTIFVSGCGVVEEENGKSPRKMWTDSIFITRFPCTSPRDGIVVDAVRSQPSQMSLDEWNFLKELPFGLVVFSTTGDLPARTADGDLDGDLYLILFDDELLKCIDRQASTREQCLDGSDEQDELIGSELLLDNQMAVVAHKKEGKPNTYIVSVGSELREMTKEEILAGDKDYAIEVLAHRGTGRNVQVELKWSDGSRQWAWLADYKVQLDVILTEYAKANDLLDKAAWRFFKKFALDETTPIYIHKHRENPLEVGMVEVLLHFDDGSQKWTSVEQVPEDGKDLLAAYATENGLVEAQEWRVVRNYIESQNDSWFERTQCFMADLHMLRNYDRLTTVLHTTFKKALREGWDIRVCEELGQAFKDSINIRKHGGKVALTRGIIPLIGETSLQEYFIAK